MAITGYAAVFYDGTPATEFPLGLNVVERFDRDAFNAYLADPANDVLGLYNHDPNQVLGRRGAGTLRLRTDQRGLFFEISESKSSVSRDVAIATRRGDIIGSSVGFQAIGERHFIEGDKTVRLITEAGLRDLGPVSYAAYPATTAEVRCRTFDGIAIPLPGDIEARARHLVENQTMDVAVRARLIQIDADARRLLR